MADLRLAAIDHVSFASQAVPPDGRGRNGGYPRPKRQRSARERLIAAPRARPPSGDL
ncbi:MAG: hypothetical protein IPI85_00180 [Dehalococcoidia bacterium]|nr:hypothetical protein [Dehalococcoidia bacterium]